MRKIFIPTHEELHRYEMGLQPGNVVYGRFTNCGYSHMFKGEFVKSTKNYHKVKVLENFRYNLDGKTLSEEVGRILHIETTGSRKWSINNTIVAPEWVDNV